jgi:2-iminobutanoate/2-iminopropanoate deaminase
MTREIIRPKGGAAPRVPLSPAVKTGNLVFVSGQPGFFGDRQIAQGDFPARTTIVCDLANPDFLLEIECVAEA